MGPCVGVDRVKCNVGWPGWIRFVRVLGLSKWQKELAK